ncbi:MAG: alpha/beta hydrolase, partial [Lactococcus chungangensis]|nr:alpha/beta hydrolase [Lactococcus chungangensis]
TQITVSGEEAQHSNLPENDEVISLIQEYLLKTFKSKGKNNFNSKI